VTSDEWQVTSWQEVGGWALHFSLVTCHWF
jgi:hypothetical protein